jgi:hypothetical protein
MKFPPPLRVRKVPPHGKVAERPLLKDVKKEKPGYEDEVLECEIIPHAHPPLIEVMTFVSKIDGKISCLV